MSFISEFLVSLLLTILIEVPIVLYFFRENKYSHKKIVVFGVLASLLTLPVLWFVISLLPLSYTWYIVIGELFVVFAEALIYKLTFHLSSRQAFKISFVANVASIVLGSTVLQLLF